MAGQSTYTWATIKPKPGNKLSDGHSYRICNKCGGNGLYVMAVINEQPWSATGTKCWSCQGTGWKVVKPRRRRCPKCGFLVEFENGATVDHEYISQVGDTFEHVKCEAA